MDMTKIEFHITEILKELNVDLSDANFTETPKRVSKLYAEFFKSIYDKDHVLRELNDIKKKVFPFSKSEDILIGNIDEKEDQLIVLKNHSCWGLCPHHLLPVEYKVSVAYLTANAFLGLSKLARITNLIFSQPVMQEQATKSLSHALKYVLESGIRDFGKQPKYKGSMIIAKGRHTCMAARGVRSNDSWTITSDLTGKFRKDESLKDEVFKLLRD